MKNTIPGHKKLKIFTVCIRQKPNLLSLSEFNALGCILSAQDKWVIWGMQESPGLYPTYYELRDQLKFSVSSNVTVTHDKIMTLENWISLSINH